MTKNSLFLLVVLAVVGFGIWFSKFGKELKKTQEIVSEKSDDTQRLVRRRTAAVSEPGASPENSLKKSQLQQEIQDLSNQLYQENQKLETQKQYIDDLRRRSNPQQQSDVTYRNQISNANQEIQYLNELMRGDQYSDTDLQREAQRIQNEQDSAMRLYHDQMSQNISDQEVLIKNTQNELEYWKLDNNYINRRDERVGYFQALLDQQTQQLQNMKLQKLEISARNLEQTQSIQAQARQIASDQASNRADIQNEIGSLRDEIQRLEYAYRQSRFSQMSTQSQIQQAEKNMQGQEEAIRTIRNLMQEKQDQLNRLQ